jgi:hypothetical protein
MMRKSGGERGSPKAPVVQASRLRFPSLGGGRGSRRFPTLAPETSYGLTARWIMAMPLVRG